MKEKRSVAWVADLPPCSDIEPETRMPNMDLDLKLDGSSLQGYEVEVIGSSLPRTDSQPLLLPANLLAEVQEARCRHNRRVNYSLGQKLFSALFPGPIRDIWFQRKGQSGGGTVRLRLDIRNHELEKIPWELLHDGDVALSLSRKLPIVRILHDGSESLSHPPSAPLKVLLATATPSDTTPLPGVALEVRQLREALRLASRSQVETVEVVEHVTLKKLDAAGTGDFNVLHFMGHGAFRDNRGFLLLEDERGKAHWCEAETIGDLLRNKKIRLLTLTACDTAVPSSDESLIGVAHAAHKAGVPAVVAMQQPVLDTAALAFALSFFAGLIGGESLESCMTAGRLSIKRALGNDHLEWSIPVLFSSLPLAEAVEPSEGSTEIIEVKNGQGVVIARNIGSMNQHFHSSRKREPRQTGR
jgi:hypothetical protein